ncbi:MAG TPA: tetratricopeptide repeat protein [Oligoflexus sp.]|uniref:tetratricopeptide repeat protein n=1 Tax=Oligoflexus sp. TaxID=1971216 RepID=UPI002D648320|nr:tetratricopeptide repeat protein [Oligoflexus sp.]HYX32412.1 tetratricopeptide repeat protein [Oligoflexus sp.]
MELDVASIFMTKSVDDEFPTTHGALALANLEAQINGIESVAATGRITLSDQAGFIDLVLLRGEVLARIVDYEWAEELANELTRYAPVNGAALLARARTRATFHRFADAQSDLDEARRLGADAAKVDAERAAIFQAIGQYEQALTLYIEAFERRVDFNSLGDLATLHAECEEITTAERFFSESRSCYRGVSPIPLAQLDFKRAHMWIVQGDLKRARSWLDSAVRLLPGYAPAQGHLAEVEAALGATDSAIARLRPLTISSDDPDYVAQMAHILSQTACSKDAREWLDRATARYIELVARHPEAYADHAAEFWLGVGADSHRALGLAQKNFEVRPTRRAYELLARIQHSVNA